MITKITTPELFNLQSNNTEGTQLPVMTRAERIAMTGMSNGELIFNSTTDSVEYYDAGAAAWYKIDYVPPPPYSNSVMYYSASDTSSYPGSGTSWFDLSGNSNTATITSSSYSNGYFDLTPTNSIITTPVNTLYQTFSYSIWVKFDTVSVSSGYNQIVFSKSQFYASNHDAFPIYAGLTSTGNFGSSLSYGDNYTPNVTNNTSVSANVWYNIAYVADSTANTAKLYIGTESTQLAQTGSTQSYTGTLVTSPNQLYSLGKAPAEYGGGVGKSSMNGKIAKFGFWDTALTEAELITIWGLGSGTS